MPWNFTETATSSIQAGSGLQLLDSNLANFLGPALDEAMAMYANTPIQGSKYFKVKNVDMNNITSQSVHGVGLMQLNEEGGVIPVDKQIIGFKQTIYNYVLRKFMGITREVLETDRMGVIGDHSRNLMHSATKTIEYMLADVFNRGFGTDNGITTADTNLSLLAEDGLALFSNSRPQPRPEAGTWGNLDTGGALTEASIFANITAGRTYVDGNGDLDPRELKKIIVAPNLEKTVKVVTSSNLTPGFSINDANSVNGLQYEVWTYLSDGIAIFEYDGDQGVEFHIRKSPSILSFNDGKDPDVFWTRCHMAMGTGIKRPGNFRGVEVS